jgi:hypothetical protein
VSEELLNVRVLPYITFSLSLQLTSFRIIAVQEKMLDPKGRMHQDRQTHCHISTDPSLQVKWTVFPHPRKHPHDYVRYEYAKILHERILTLISTMNCTFVCQIPHSVCVYIYICMYIMSLLNFYITKRQELHPTLPLCFLPFGKPYKGSNAGSFIGCGVPSGSEYKAQPFPIIQHYYGTFSLKTWHVPKHRQR